MFKKNNGYSDAEMLLLAKAGSSDAKLASEATYLLAKALELPLRKSLFAGDVVTDIFNPADYTNNQTTPEFPLDIIVPGTQKDYVAYTLPNHGYIPQRHTEGDYVQIPGYEIGNSIDWLLKFSKNANWNVVERCMQVLRAGFVKKINDDGWHTLLAAGLDRNVAVFDSDAGSGQFTKRLISLMKTVMSRGGGGNSATMNRAKLTDVYTSPEALEDMRNWGVDIIDEVTRREIYRADDNPSAVFGVNLHRLDELGEGQEYQLFYTSSLAGSLQTNDLELVVGLDLSKNDSFVMPITAELELFDDPALHRQRRSGVYGWMGLGFGVLDNRRIILGSL